LKTTVLVRAAAAALIALALAACSAINPITTQNRYAPSDGVQTQIGDDAKALNLLVVTTAKDAPAVLTGSLYNGGSTDLNITVSIDGTIVDTVPVAAGSTVQLGTGENQTLVQGTSPAAPGGLAGVWVGTLELGTAQVQVPVVDGTLDEYAGIVDSIPPLPTASPAA